MISSHPPDPEPENITEECNLNKNCCLLCYTHYINEEIEKTIIERNKAYILYEAKTEELENYKKMKSIIENCKNNLELKNELLELLQKNKSHEETENH